MPTETQRTVVIEMPQSIYDYTAKLAKGANLTVGDFLIMAALCNGLSAASDHELVGECVTILDLWERWGHYPPNGVTARIIS